MKLFFQFIIVCISNIPSDLDNNTTASNLDNNTNKHNLLTRQSAKNNSINNKDYSDCYEEELDNILEEDSEDNENFNEDFEDSNITELEDSSIDYYADKLDKIFEAHDTLVNQENVKNLLKKEENIYENCDEKVRKAIIEDHIYEDFDKNLPKKLKEDHIYENCDENLLKKLKREDLIENYWQERERQWQERDANDKKLIANELWHKAWMQRFQKNKSFERKLRLKMANESKNGKDIGTLKRMLNILHNKPLYKFDTRYNKVFETKNNKHNL